MQLSDLIAAVRDEVQDPSKYRWSDATITRYLNDAQLDLIQISRKLQVWQSNVSAGSQYIEKPTDLLLPKRMWFQVSDFRYPLEIKYGMPPESVIVTGDPRHVYLIGTYIYLYPVVQQSGTLYIEGVQRPINMSATTDIPTVEDADNLLIAYAAWMCLSSDGDPLAAVKQQYYQQKKMEWSILDAQKYPLPDRIERNWWW